MTQENNSKKDLNSEIEINKPLDLRITEDDSPTVISEDFFDVMPEIITDKNKKENKETENNVNSPTDISEDFFDVMPPDKTTTVYKDENKSLSNKHIDEQITPTPM